MYSKNNSSSWSFPLPFFSKKKKKGIMDGRKQKEWEEVEEHIGLKAMEISSRAIQVFSEIGFLIRNWCVGYLYNSGTLKRSAPACDSGVNQEPMEVLLISNFCLSSSPKFYDVT